MITIVCLVEESISNSLRCGCSDSICKRPECLLLYVDIVRWLCQHHAPEKCRTTDDLICETITRRSLVADGPACLLYYHKVSTVHQICQFVNYSIKDAQVKYFNIVCVKNPTDELQGKLAKNEVLAGEQVCHGCDNHTTLLEVNSCNLSQGVWITGAGQLAYTSHNVNDNGFFIWLLVEIFNEFVKDPR